MFIWNSNLLVSIYNHNISSATPCLWVERLRYCRSTEKIFTCKNPPKPMTNLKTLVRKIRPLHLSVFHPIRQFHMAVFWDCFENFWNSFFTTLMKIVVLLYKQKISIMYSLHFILSSLLQYSSDSWNNRKSYWLSI